MRYKEFIPESSPDTPTGSVTHDLMISKLWLCKKLMDLNLTNFDNIYILGSWYGALALIIKRLDWSWDNIICVDSDINKADYLTHLIQKHNLSNIHSVCQSAEDLSYQGNNILVINTSTNDIDGSEWMNPIPHGTIVAFQGRDKQDVSNGIETLSEFNEYYKLIQTLYIGKIKIKGVKNDWYNRFMKIGIK